MFFVPFDTGIPDFDSLIIVKGCGYGQLRDFHENGTVDVYMGAGRTFTLPGSARWRYARYPR